MNSNRKSCLYILFIVLIPIAILLIYIFTDSFFTRTEIYCIPHKNIYIKTILNPRDKSGYILFGYHQDLNLSDSVDYVNVYPNINNSVIINSDCDTIWFYNQIKYNRLKEEEYTIMTRPKEINQYRFNIIDGINETDTIFFHKRKGTKPIILKDTYFEISVMDHFKKVWFKDANDSTFTELKPLQ